VRHAPSVRRRHELLTIAGLTAATAAFGAAVALAATSKNVAFSDPKGDVSGSLDLQRASLTRASDGRLRAVVTLAAKVEPRAFLARSGPPGSICLKVWTDADADPQASVPDRLVCVTARAKDELRASVFEQAEQGLPKRLGSASVAVNKSGRSIVLRVSQTSLGRPKLIRFAVESTRPGCDRVSCIDGAPDKGAVRRFRLHD
jgi:hypothetical protein